MSGATTPTLSPWRTGQPHPWDVPRDVLIVVGSTPLARISRSTNGLFLKRNPLIPAPSQIVNWYNDQGLEIVALDFEEPDQQSSLTRVNAFIKQYKVPYTCLIAGASADMWDKVPQAVNLNTWPATLFIGRDGRVKATHAGFASPASGVYNAELKKEFTSNIERLLRENREQKSE